MDEQQISNVPNWKLYFSIVSVVLAISVTFNVATVFNINIAGRIGQIGGNQTNYNIQNLPQWAQDELSSQSTQIGSLQSQVSTLQSQNSVLQGQISDLQSKLQLSVVSISGTVKTNFGTIPTNVNFDDGIGKHTFKITSGAYVASLPNNRNYAITVDYLPSVSGPCTPSQSPLNLQSTSTTYTLNLQC